MTPVVTVMTVMPEEIISVVTNGDLLFDLDDVGVTGASHVVSQADAIVVLKEDVNVLKDFRNF